MSQTTFKYCPSWSHWLQFKEASFHVYTFKCSFFLDQLKTLRESNLQLIPTDLREYLKMLLSTTAELRPTAIQLTKISFFDDVGVKTLTNLDSQFQWDNVQKSQFYKGLPQIVPKLPQRLAICHLLTSGQYYKCSAILTYDNFHLYTHSVINYGLRTFTRSKVPTNVHWYHFCSRIK